MFNRLKYLALLFLHSAAALAATFYVNPSGNDSKSGQSEATAWKTVAKVNGTAFQPGDQIFFARGGEWRESLRVSSSGAAGKPIIFDAYGTGAKPRFLGSDVLPIASFTPIGGGRYSFKLPKIDAVLQDHVFIPSKLDNGTVTITVPDSDPRANGKVYTGCMRGNVIAVLGRHHVTLRNLIADETAGQLADGTVQGYGIRVEGGSDVALEDCEAQRCGRHNFGVINSTAFVGRRLHAAYAQPDTPGGNSFYVAYADENAAGMCTGEWHDISGEHLEDGKNGFYPFFLSHGPKQGSLLVSNASSSAKISFMTAPVTVKGGTLRGNGSLENFGAGILIDGLTLLDNAAIDQWAGDGVIQNCIAASTPTNNGPTGYSTAILFRDKAKNNVVRFNTLVTKRFACLTTLAPDSGTKWYGNVMLSEGNAVFSDKPAAGIEADFNFYSANANVWNQPLAAWKKLGFDANSLSGDPKFRDAAKNDFQLQPDSPCAGAAKLAKEKLPAADFAGKARPNTKPACIGALEKQ